MVTPTDRATGIAREPEAIYRELNLLDRPCFVVRDELGVGVPAAAGLARPAQVLAAVPSLPPASLGDAAFRAAHGVGHAYHGGAMANGIASADMVVALARAGFLGRSARPGC